MQRTALRARKIIAFLKVGISPTVLPIYGCAAADAQAVGPLLLTSVPDEGLLGRLFPLIMPVYQTSMSMGKLCNVSSLLSSTSARFLVS